MQVEGHRASDLSDVPATGEWVSNAYPTCPPARDSLPKGRLIPDVVTMGHPVVTEDLSLVDGDASD